MYVLNWLALPRPSGYVAKSGPLCPQERKHVISQPEPQNWSDAEGPGVGVSREVVFKRLSV